MSYSVRQLLHACPRKFELTKLIANSGTDFGAEPGGSIDLTFGSTVGVGVQEILTTQSEDKAILQALLTWDLPLLEENSKKKKSFGLALLAISKFQAMYPGIEAEYELLVFRGKPAVELSFCIELPGGVRYYGHIDAVLRHKTTGMLTVLEVKTTGYNYIDAAMYQNSEQALGYGIVLSLIAKELDTSATFRVIYLVYRTTAMEWTAMPFVKTYLQRVEFLHSLIMDSDQLGDMLNADFFPKRGGSCMAYNRRCQFFGLCHLSNERFGKVKQLVELCKDDREPVDPKRAEFITGQDAVIELLQEETQ